MDMLFPNWKMPDKYSKKEVNQEHLRKENVAVVLKPRIKSVPYEDRRLTLSKF